MLPLLPSPGDRLLTTERQTAKLLIQNPNLFPVAWDGLTTADFTHPAYAAVFTAVEKATVEVGAAGVAPRTRSGYTRSRKPARLTRSALWLPRWPWNRSQSMAR